MQLVSLTQVSANIRKWLWCCYFFWSGTWLCIVIVTFYASAHDTFTASAQTMWRFSIRLSLTTVRNWLTAINCLLLNSKVHSNTSLIAFCVSYCQRSITIFGQTPCQSNTRHLKLFPCSNFNSDISHVTVIGIRHYQIGCLADCKVIGSKQKTMECALPWPGQLPELYRRQKIPYAYAII